MDVSKPGKYIFSIASTTPVRCILSTFGMLQVPDSALPSEQWHARQHDVHCTAWERVLLWRGVQISLRVMKWGHVLCAARVALHATNEEFIQQKCKWHCEQRHKHGYLCAHYMVPNRKEKVNIRIFGDLAIAAEPVRRTKLACFVLAIATSRALPKGFHRCDRRPYVIVRMIESFCTQSRFQFAVHHFPFRRHE